MATSRVVDTFAQDRLPPLAQQPEFLFELPELQFAQQLNCAATLLDGAIARGWGERPCILAAGGVRWTYARLLAQTNRIANVLVNDMGLQPGNRVLLRAPNNPMLAASWLAVVKAGAIAVATMPLLRAKELGQVIAKAQISHALCDLRLADELAAAAQQHPVLRHIRHFNGADGTPAAPAAPTAPAAPAIAPAVAADAAVRTDQSSYSLESAMARQPAQFEAFDSAATDTCMIEIGRAHV